jgi:sialic acid synthase SpsE
MSALIIAEAGSAWQFGRLPLRNAKQAIAIAKACGADAVKFQWCSDGHAMAKRRRFKGNPYKILEWPKAWIAELAAQCVRCFLSRMWR